MNPVSTPSAPSPVRNPCQQARPCGLPTNTNGSLRNELGIVSSWRAPGNELGFVSWAWRVSRSLHRCMRSLLAAIENRGRHGLSKTSQRGDTKEALSLPAVSPGLAAGGRYAHANRTSTEGTWSPVQSGLCCHAATRRLACIALPRAN